MVKEVDVEYLDSGVSGDAVLHRKSGYFSEPAHGLLVRGEVALRVVRMGKNLVEGNRHRNPLQTALDTCF